MVLNTWEAVYFDHNLDTLIELADSAADLGVERFVLDDGWFRGRRDDTAGLGDWFVDETLWPDGLTPLIEAVTSRGMEFGLWVEPEMINLDSDVARAHPDWIVGPAAASHKDGGRLPLAWRNQHVIDLVNPEAWQYIFDRIDALLRENNISYLKWDQNRDLTEHGHAGRSSVHEQTLAAYRLFDELRKAHPGVEIESCSSGGARVDLGILERTDRIWGSDCNDALERQTIQRWTGVVVPPELVGGHIGPTTSHTTARTHDLSFRAITALFGHFGMEWDVREVQGERARGTQALHRAVQGAPRADPQRPDGPGRRPRRFAHAPRRGGRFRCWFRCRLRFRCCGHDGGPVRPGEHAHLVRRAAGTGRPARARGGMAATGWRPSSRPRRTPITATPSPRSSRRHGWLPARRPAAASWPRWGSRCPASTRSTRWC